MSRINTLSTFYYGFNVTNANNAINFSEAGGPEITTYLTINDYTLTSYALEIAQRMTLAGTQTYTATVDRVTRKITISAPGAFELLTATGSQQAIAIWNLAGFTTIADKTGDSTYEGENAAGFEYRPQLTLFDYLALEDNLVKESSSVNISANGVVQTISFGDGQRMECGIRGATNLTGLKIKPFFENANGRQALRDFMNYLITKSKVEFMPDVADRNTFYELLLDSTSADRNGTRYKIENMKGANDFYETGPLVFRKVIE
jgi:hypothetical protein